MLPSKTGWGKMLEKRGGAYETANAMVDVAAALEGTGSGGV